MPRPPTAPMAPRSNASERIWRARSHQVAPIAERIASSRWRKEARTNRRLATLAHAMSKRKMTAPISARISVRGVVTEAIGNPDIGRGFQICGGREVDLKVRREDSDDSRTKGLPLI